MKENKAMIDNKMVNDNHQQGIERVKQREKMPMGQPGKMGKGDKADWKRSGGSLTPRKA